MKQTTIFYYFFSKIRVLIPEIFYICTLNILILFVMGHNINRIKVVLVDKRKSNKWLAEQLNVSPSTVSKWCTNDAQPSLETFMQIAKFLKVNPNELLRFDE